eukprot:CAMPEP_0174290972 /NCGR_PEP_ID=MMETSP0809-20121228/30697_1 /TAXON_ID=73025 ORGANISM="Eutreptiella gymnastica-like, Strain CCMP1594" /NCGR_SAMPLE_ID=MMETSP0809 /ASSEMBLY_ACC=CAM_ASM_000658 /LENGTH=68 /DNA_ID=CAMNT_0015390027 /DNA_START=75 /DNA_END=278 /DNA_ORIENTATION=+
MSGNLATRAQITSEDDLRPIVDFTNSSSYCDLVEEDIREGAVLSDEDEAVDAENDSEIVEDIDMSPTL